jgi:hypothetical protein
MSEQIQTPKPEVHVNVVHARNDQPKPKLVWVPVQTFEEGDYVVQVQAADRGHERYFYSMSAGTKGLDERVRPFMALKPGMPLPSGTLPGLLVKAECWIAERQAAEAEAQEQWQARKAARDAKRDGPQGAQPRRVMSPGKTARDKAKRLRK